MTDLKITGQCSQEGADRAKRIEAEANAKVKIIVAAFFGIAIVILAASFGDYMLGY